MKNYETPIIKVVVLECNDVILASSDTNFGNWSWDEEEGI